MVDHIQQSTTKEEFSGVVMLCDFNIQGNSTFFYRPPGIVKFAGQRIILDAKKNISTVFVT